MKIVVVSLFDGLSGGRVALDRVDDIEVERYYSSEVDKYAIQVADKNYPQDTEYRLGDVTKIDGNKLRKKILKKFPSSKIILIGGSPCQGFSLVGKLKGSSTSCGIDVTTLEQYLTLKKQDFEFNGQSYLFWEYIRIQKELQPDFFMLENVKITKKWLPMFNNTIGVEPIEINSALVSAQNRIRLYWTNIPSITLPIDKNITLIDILERNAISKQISKKSCNKYAPKGGEFVDPYNKTNLKGIKSTTLRTNSSNGNMWIKTIDGYRNLTPIECERLQTLNDGYTDGVSNTQRYKMISNGWTIDVVSHIFKGLI